MLPDLRERYPGLPLPTINGAFASSRLFEALARLLQAFAERHRCSSLSMISEALLQTLLERGILVPHLIGGSNWVFEPQPSILFIFNYCVKQGI